MVSYYCNEAMLLLPNVRSVTDCTRHVLEVVTEEGAKITMVIARLRNTPEESLRATIDKGLAEQERSRAGYKLLSKSEVEYGGLLGIETKVRFMEKEAGPTFHYGFHTIIEQDRVGFFGISSVAEATACDAWMVETLTNLRIRS